MTVSTSRSHVTAVYVAFGVAHLDVAWLDDHDDIFVVHNDRLLEESAVHHPRVTHLYPPGNVGFGRGVNLALEAVTTDRIILCNPDTALTRAHRDALYSAERDEVVTVPLSDARGEPTWVVLPYPGPATVLAMGYRVGRWLGRSSLRRDALTRLITGRGISYRAFLGARGGSWPLATHWASAAVLSVATARLREVGGFDPGFFLYMEDVDLCARLAARYPSMKIRLADTNPATHSVGGSSEGHHALRVEDERLRSIRRYCDLQSGWTWRLVGALMSPRTAWLRYRSHGGRLQTAGAP